jgi:hypothetical protein
MRKFLLLAATAALALGLGPSVAGAQTCSPGDPSYPGCLNQTDTSTQSYGTKGPGDTFTVTSCGFSDGVSLQLNGNGAGSDTLSNGCASETVTIVSGGSALGTARFAAAGLQLAATAPQVSIDGRTYTARAGSNTLAVFGIATDGRDKVVNNTFVIVGSTSSGGNGALPRTGAMILRWSLAALALMAVGTLLVLADRRRKVTPVRNDSTPRI